MTTPTSTRTPPQRRFEGYVLTTRVADDGGLASVPSSALTRAPGTVGNGFASGSVGTPASIGFGFQLDGVTYTQWVASTGGWMALVDPVSGTFSSTEVMSSSLQNTTIKQSFSSNAVLLAPWFDASLVNASDTVAQGSPAATRYGFTPTFSDRVSKGLQGPPTVYDPTRFGVAYRADSSRERGRRLVVRWDTLTDPARGAERLTFDVVLYENGTIEYRYAPRRSLSISPTPNANESAACGVFMPNGTNRWRDFSVGLGRGDGFRQACPLGGAVFTGAYTDTNTETGVTASYNVGLRPYVNWPASYVAGCTMTFSPPKLRRRVLPREAIRASGVADRLPTVSRVVSVVDPDASTTFDDRLSLPFGATTVVSYPTTLPRFYKGSAGSPDQQDVFDGDLSLTGTLSQRASSGWIEVKRQHPTQAFDEARHPDQTDGAASSAYFLTGSSLAVVGAGFDEGLRSKSHLHVRLRVDQPTSMLSGTAAVYYYNHAARAWLVPANSTYAVASGSSAVPAGTTTGDLTSPSTTATGGNNDASQGRVLEDVRGFGPVGNLVASGTVNRGSTGYLSQSDPSIGAAYGQDAVTQAVSKRYDRTVTNAATYQATTDEWFTLPTDVPFLIEKVVISFPMAAGAGWFNDLTTCFAPLDDPQLNSFDFAGPALTLALFNQATFGPGSRRDLILTGTVTHANDTVPSVAYHVGGSASELVPVGFTAFAGPPGAVVPAATTYTGSVTVACTALSSNGVVAKYRRLASSTATSNRTQLINLIQQQTLVLPTTVASSSALLEDAHVAYVHPLGRGGSGMEPAGRSVLGNELEGFQGYVGEAFGVVANPFLLTGSAFTAMSASIVASAATSVAALAALVLETHVAAPYLVMPGDRLVLALSKVRPFFYSSTLPLSGTTGHDVTLRPGTIELTFYGTALQAGVGYDDTTTQRVGSTVAHDVVGDGPIVDQFEPWYRAELSGTYTDRVITGSMNGYPPPPNAKPLTVLGHTVYNVNGTLVRPDRTINNRGLAFSRLNARNSQLPDLATATTAMFPLKSQRLQPNWETAGDPRNVGYVDYGERFYDSLMPALDEAFARDGCGFFTLACPNPYTILNGEVSAFCDIVGDPRRIDVTSTSSFADDPFRQHPAYVFLDSVRSGSSFVGPGPLLNNKWSSAYPFEPRYSGVNRQLALQNSINATFTYNLDVGLEPIITLPRRCTGLVVGYQKPVGADVAGVQQNTWFMDTNVSTALTWPTASGGTPAALSNVGNSGSMTTDDLSRVMYGFGDVNDCYTITADDGARHLRGGANHCPAARSLDAQNATFAESLFTGSTYSFSPVIRGWKFGVASGVPLYTKAVFRRGRYGQFRDLLEGRQYTRLYNLDTVQQGTVGPAVVEVKFIDVQSKRQTNPALTWSNNQDTFVTASVPYTDGISRDRPPLNVNQLNTTVISVAPDGNGNLTL